MASIRRLDRSRPFGEVFPATMRAAYVQDHLHFDAQGFCIEDAPPEKPTQPAEKGPPSGALSISGAAQPATPPTPIGPLQPAPETYWTTAPWPALRKQMKETLGVWPANRVAALNVLKERGLIVP